jgi:hypothetical protein
MCDFITNLGAGIAQPIKRRVTRWTAGVQFPVVVRDFSLFHYVQTDSGAHVASCPMSTGNYFPGIKRPGRKADHSHI